MTNEELVVRIKAGIDTAENMLALWEQNRRYIHSIAKHYEGSAELEDLEQEGYLALYDAIDGYDIESGYKFLTYVTRWIKQRMIRYIQNNGTVRIPVHECGKLQEYRKVVNAYSTYLGRTPTRHEIAVNMGISDKKVALLERTAKMWKIGSLDSYLTEEDGGTIGDMVPCDVDIEGDVLEEVTQEQLKEVIWSCVDELPELQAYVLHQRFKKDVTYKSIGESMGVSTERVRQIEHTAMRSLRHSKKSGLLRSFLMDERIYSIGLTGNGVTQFNRTWTSSTERAAMLCKN